MTHTPEQPDGVIELDEETKALLTQGKPYRLDPETPLNVSIHITALDPTKMNICVVRIDPEHATAWQCAAVRDYFEEHLKPLGVAVVLVMSGVVEAQFAQVADPAHTELLRRVPQPEAWEHGLLNEIEAAIQAYDARLGREPNNEALRD